MARTSAEAAPGDAATASPDASGASSAPPGVIPPGGDSSAMSSESYRSSGGSPGSSLPEEDRSGDPTLAPPANPGAGSQAAGRAAAEAAARAASGGSSGGSSGSEYSSDSSGSSLSGGMAIEGSGGVGGGTSAGPDFSSPFKGAQSFLDAVKSKDLDLVADAVALRSVTQGSAKNKTKYFQPLLERSAGPEVLDELATLFDGMTIEGRNDPRSTGEMGVILSKSDEKQGYMNITLQMRKEKAGWKVIDFSNLRSMGRPGQPKRR
jgi:hypothetical protein